MSTLTVRSPWMLMGGKSYIHSIIYALPGQLKWNWILSRRIDSARNKSPWNKGGGAAFGWMGKLTVRFIVVIAVE